MKILAELQRRNVIRMAGLYLVGAWLIVQVASTVFPAFELPDWALRGVILILAIGFIPALVFSWVFELTRTGLKRDDEVAANESIAPQTAQRMNRMLLVVMTLALGYFAIDKFVLAPGRVAATPATPALSADPLAAPVPAPITAHPKSIAVLPFTDFSPAGDQGWFADGLADEILNTLARTPDLQVSARTSSFRYRGSTLTIPEIAGELRVAHVLEGSVRSTPQRMRVTAQLIRAADGFQVWSQDYDRDPADMIEIQEDLARQIAMAMQTSMDPQALADMATVGTRSIEAYQRFIRGRIALIDGSREGYASSYQLFEEARSLDPDFAAAHGLAAAYWLEQMDATSILKGLVDCVAMDCPGAFAERIDLAIGRAKSPVDRSAYRAQKAIHDLRWREAIVLLEAVAAQRPGDATVQQQVLDVAARLVDKALMRRTLDAIWELAQARVDQAIVHINWAHRTGDFPRAGREAMVLAQIWQDNPRILYQAHRALLWAGRVADAAEILTRWQALDDDETWAMLPPARQACAEGRRAEVETALTRLTADQISQRWHLLMLLGRKDEAAALLQPLEHGGNLSSLSDFLIFLHFDPAPFPSVMALLAREKIDRPPPVSLPFACPPADAAP
jgi:TolB-like protein